MVSWDPEAAGNAAIYLRMNQFDLLDIRNQPFSAKTACWVPDKGKSENLVKIFLGFKFHSLKIFIVTKRFIFKDSKIFDKYNQLIGLALINISNFVNLIF
jgi:hypothetical protein